MKYFVTGATGFLGREIVRQLRSDGHDVVALVRSPSAAARVLDPGVTLHAGDVTDPDSMRQAMLGVDGVFHVAGWYKIGAIGQEDLAHQVNVEGTRNVLRLMEELGIPKGVYTSTLAVFSDTRGIVVDETYRHDGPWLSLYDRTKWLAHYSVAEPMMAAGLPLVVVQPGLIYGPGDSGPMHDVWVQFLRRRLPAIPGGSAYCWGHIEDTARGHIQAMERGRTGESYIIAGPPHTFRSAMALAERVTGVKAPRIVVPPALGRVASLVAGVAEHVVTLPETYRSETLRVSAGVTYLGDSAKARREFGFSTRSLEDGFPAVLRELMGRLGSVPAS